MKELVGQFFIYLAFAYIISALTLVVIRRLRLPDFLAYLMTGALFGAFLLLLSDYPQILNRVFNDNNVFLLFANHIGVLVFLILIGLNFDPQFFRWVDGENLVFSTVLASLTILSVGIISFFFVTGQDWWATLFLTTAFLSINIGAVAQSYLSETGLVKKQTTNLLQMALSLDLLAIIAIAAIDTIKQNLHRDFTVLDLMYFLLFLLFSLPILMRQRFSFYLARRSPPATNSILFLAMGIFFISLNLAYNTGLSLVFIGFWAGLFLKSMIPSVEKFQRQRLLQVGAFFFLIPFTDMGRAMVMAFQHTYLIWKNFNFLMAALILLAIAFGLYVRYRKQPLLFLVLGTFPRGELTLIIFWLAYRQRILPAEVFIPGIFVVMISVLVGHLVFRRSSTGVD
ncbi:MAG: hypothetical protein GXO78_13475 [Calditrichaeota bacterium]|nr:hypothetical protein [Calditrichota bacterium]